MTSAPKLVQIGGYLRTSSRAQDATSQRVAIERAATSRGDAIAIWYSEQRSGRTIDRPELDLIRADARAGELHLLYLYRLDRLTRSGVRDTLDVIEELQGHGCQVVTVADGFDLNGPWAELVISVMSWAARMERVAINERIASARDRLESEGRSWGRPPRLIGPRLDRARDLQAGGHTIREISIALKVPRSTVARALSRKDDHADTSINEAPEPSQPGAPMKRTSGTPDE